MIVTTEEGYLNFLKSRSLILNRPENDPSRPPRFLQSIDFSLQGVQRMLDERLAVGGLIAHAKEQAREASRVWKNFRSRQPNLAKNAKPISHFAEDINRTKARVRLCEAECRELNRLKDELLAKQAAEQKGHYRKPRGVTKMNGTSIASVDGRKVVENDDGVAVFADDRSEVQPYLDQLKAKKRRRAIEKERAETETAKSIAEARGEKFTPKRRLSSYIKRREGESANNQ